MTTFQRIRTTKRNYLSSKTMQIMYYTKYSTKHIGVELNT